jgi:predicted RNA-binding Zn-ribbon protein involved in translation (DUF1610 family)
LPGIVNRYPDAAMILLEEKYMVDFVTLTCPSCGGKLQITKDIERFACGHCGNEHIVKRSGGIVALEPVVEGLKKIQKGTDKTASELAIRRLKEEIYNLDVRVRHLINEGFRKQGLFEFGNDPNHIFNLYYILYNWAKPRGGILKNGTKVKNLQGQAYMKETIYDVTALELEEAMLTVPSKKNLIKFKQYVEQLIDLKKQISEKILELQKHEEIVRG